MGRLQGDVVAVVLPGGRDYRGRPLPGERFEFQAVVVPEGSDMRAGSDGVLTWVKTDKKLLIPAGWPVPDELVNGAQVEVRGEEYVVDGSPVEHRSPYGTGRGGLEVVLSNAPAA